MKKTILLLLVFPLLSFTVHKYYLSLTQIEYNTKAKSLQFITNVFMDDIELAINKEYQVDLQLTTKKELANADDYFKEYLHKNFNVKVNNIDKDFVFIGKEYDGDIVYFYFEIENILSVNNIEIKNTILVNQFEDQQNLIKSKVNGKHKSVRLNKSNDKSLLNF